MVFVRCGLFLKGTRWITKLLYMFCSMLFQVKFGRKTYFCKFKDCIVEILKNCRSHLNTLQYFIV